MSLKTDLQQAQIEAMKNKDELKKDCLRQLSAAIKNKEIESRTELDDEQVQVVALGLSKQLKDALQDFKKGGRADLVEKTEQEMSILESFLPQMLSTEKLRELVQKAIADSGAGGTKDMGKVMGLVMKDIGGKADGNQVKEIATQLLG